MPRRRDSREGNETETMGLPNILRYFKEVILARFHLMHCVPHPRWHGLHGYFEVIQTISWGLEQLGHSVAYARNGYDPGAVNILFGAQVMPIDFLKQLPNNTIVYNFEQLRNLPTSRIRPEIAFCATRFEIWEFSAANLQAWRDLGATAVKSVPIGWAPVLGRIARPVTQDIDVLMYGMSGDKRLRAFHSLSQSGLSTMFISGLYGEGRDSLIGRSKIVLNVNLYDFAQIFEVVRVSYLLANKKAVVATQDPETFVEADIESAVKFTHIDQLKAACCHLIENDAERAGMEQRGFDVISRRDIRDILRNVV